MPIHGVCGSALAAQRSVSVPEPLRRRQPPESRGCPVPSTLNRMVAPERKQSSVGGGFAGERRLSAKDRAFEAGLQASVA
jgi:hypothetical protein